MVCNLLLVVMTNFRKNTNLQAISTEKRVQWIIPKVTQTCGNLSWNLIVIKFNYLVTVSNNLIGLLIVEKPIKQL